LGQEKSAQTAAGVVEGCGHVRNIGRADETDQPVAKVLPLDQDEDDEDDDQQRRRERPKQRIDKRNHCLQRAAGRLVHLDRDQADSGNGRRGRDLRLTGLSLSALDLFVELFEDDLRAFERFAAAAAGAAQPLDLFADRLLILRQIVGERGDLGRENPAEPGDRREGDQDDNHDRERPRQPQSLQRPDRGRQHETQDAGKRERHQHFPREKHDRHDDHANQQRVQRRRRRIHVSPKWGCVRTGRPNLKH
jgi:hypothetical protein